MQESTTTHINRVELRELQVFYINIKKILSDFLLDYLIIDYLYLLFMYFCKWNWSLIYYYYYVFKYTQINNWTNNSSPSFLP